MHSFDFSAPAALYLGSTPTNAEAQGPRHFSCAALAIRFAMEEAAPVSLRGARLQVGSQSYSANELHWLYNSPNYPMLHKQRYPQTLAA